MLLVYCCMGIDLVQLQFSMNPLKFVRCVQMLKISWNPGKRQNVSSCVSTLHTSKELYMSRFMDETGSDSRSKKYHPAFRPNFLHLMKSHIILTSGAGSGIGTCLQSFTTCVRMSFKMPCETNRKKNNSLI